MSAALKGWILPFIRHTLTNSTRNSTSSKKQMEMENHMGTERTGSLGCIGWLIVILSGLFVFLLFPVTIWFCFKTVQEYERAVIFRLGRITDRKPKGPAFKLFISYKKTTTTLTTCKM
uniref:Band 7 domain-containing protein n=1 Tax=Oryzias latipes TaxID=8090 RepID=A0A3P9JIT3_ORYLA